MDSVRANSPSGILPRVALAWEVARLFLGRSLRGDVLIKDKYAVFISYRHVEPDRRWAIWLHGALESFVIPRGLRGSPDHRRIGRIFRDEEELAASSHLSADIKGALDRSDWLIVVCSPRATKSEWVSAEIRYFRKLQRDDRILALLIEGNPAASFPHDLYEILNVGQRRAGARPRRTAGGRRAAERRSQSPHGQALGQAETCRDSSRLQVR